MANQGLLEDIQSNLTDLQRLEEGLEADFMDDTAPTVQEYTQKEFDETFKQQLDWQGEYHRLEKQLEDERYSHEQKLRNLKQNSEKRIQCLTIENNALLQRVAELKPDADKVDAFKREKEEQLHALKREIQKLTRGAQEAEQLNVTLMQAMDERNNPPEHRIERHYNVTETATGQYELEYTDLQDEVFGAVVDAVAIISSLGEISSSIPPHHHQMYSDFGIMNPHCTDWERTDLIEAELKIRYACLAVYRRCMEVYRTRRISRAQIYAISNALYDLKEDVVSFYNKKGFGDVSSNWDRAHWDDAIHFVLCHMGFSAAFVKLGRLLVPFHTHVMGDGFCDLLKVYENPFLQIDDQESSKKCPFFDGVSLASPAFVYVRMPRDVRCITKAFAQMPDAAYKATSIVVTDQEAGAGVIYILQIGFQNRAYKFKHPNGRDLLFKNGGVFDELEITREGMIEKTTRHPYSPLKLLAVVYVRCMEDDSRTEK